MLRPKNTFIRREGVAITHNGNGYVVVAEFKNLTMNTEREIKVRDAIKYCIENFDSQTATNRIVEFWKDELKLQEQQCNIANVVKSLPTDECVEQWWAEGKDQQKGFWQEAPYRTNGDVVEEIKTALKYFIETWQR